MPKIDFINELKALGYNAQEYSNDFVCFDYEIPVGKFLGRKVKLAFQFDNAYPMNPPSGGPHFSPLLLPITGGGGSHPFGAIHNSPLGIEWEYWSRPFISWNITDKNAKTYMAHIRNLLAKIS